MIDFLIKSTVSLGILYFFYILFLSRIKTFSFNRYFLLGSLVFSLVIPFIIIPVESNLLPLPDATGIIAGTGTIEQTGVSLIPSQEQGIITIEVLSYFYVAICLILFLRFTSNLFSIIKTIYGNQKESNHNYKLVLVNRQVLPHTFFKYIMVNRNDYENGRIDVALIQHEVAHCKQWHSLDIVFIELLKVILWINPFLWLFKKPIQLNHEYMADSSVLTRYSIKMYQSTLISVVMSNSDGILVSNFNFSLTKQRLEMMTKKKSKNKSILGKMSSIILMLVLGLTMSFSPKSILQDDGLNTESEWWYPILVKNNILLNSSFDNYDYVFEMGIKKSNEDGKINLMDVVFIYRVDEGYDILRASIANHDLKKKTISAKDVKLSMFRFWDYEDMPKSVEVRLFDELEIQFHDDSTITSSGKRLEKWEAKNGKGNVIRTDNYK